MISFGDGNKTPSQKMKAVNELESFTLKLSQIFLSHVRFMLDLKDFIRNTVVAIERSRDERIIIDPSRYERYSIEKNIQWDINLILEMSLIKIFSEYENFLRVFFYEIGKIDDIYTEEFPKRDKNIITFSKYLKKVFDFNISSELDCWNQLVENYYRRNAYVHTKGRIYKNYIRRVPNVSEFDKGKLEINLEYLKDCIDNILAFFEYIYMNIGKYFDCSEMDQILSELNERRNYGINQFYFTKFKIKI